MDENLKKIKNMLLQYTTKKIYSNELNGVEATTLSEIYEEIKKKKEDDSDIRPMAEYFVKQKYFKDDNGAYYSFESFNQRIIKYNKIEPTKYVDFEDENDDEDYCWYKQNGVTYNEGCRTVLSSEDVLLNRFKNLKPITSEEYQIMHFKIKLLSEIKHHITSKENKINEQVKRVKFLGSTLRLCEYTKNMTREEYIRLANLIDEETHKDVNEYLKYLNEKYKDKYIYIRDRETLDIYKVLKFELIDQTIQMHSSEKYSINSSSAYKTIYADDYEHIDLIIDEVDENFVKEIDKFITDFIIKKI